MRFTKLLIYSASSNVGMHIIQQARIEMPETFIIALASPQHHSYLKKLGAHAVFDYRSETLAEDVRALGRDIRRGVDCYSRGTSTVEAAQCMLPSHPPEKDESAPPFQRRIVRMVPQWLMKGTLPAGVTAEDWILTYTASGKVSREKKTFLPPWLILPLLSKALPLLLQILSRHARTLPTRTTLLQEPWPAIGIRRRQACQTSSHAWRAG